MLLLILFVIFYLLLRDKCLNFSLTQKKLSVIIVAVELYDVSMPIHEDMLVWIGDPKVSIEKVATLKKDGVMLSHFSFGSHTGTHIDAPAHFLENGKTLDQIPLEKFMGRCRVLDLTDINHQEILVSNLTAYNIQKGDRILFKTGNFRLLKNPVFPKNYVSLSIGAAEYLVKKGVYLVGTDFLGIEKKASPGHPVHKALLSHNIVIVEGLNLADVPEGEYNMICLPLNVVGVDGSPARVVLYE